MDLNEFAKLSSRHTTGEAPCSRPDAQVKLNISTGPIIVVESCNPISWYSNIYLKYRSGQRLPCTSCFLHRYQD